jgi:hypothetical protein
MSSEGMGGNTFSIATRNATPINPMESITLVAQSITNEY